MFCVTCTGNILFVSIFSHTCSAVYGYIAFVSDIGLIISFKGTDINNIHDWMNDGDILKDEYINLNDQSKHGNVHSGFYQDYKSIREKLYSIVYEVLLKSSLLMKSSSSKNLDCSNNIDDKNSILCLMPIYIIGHSLGGALATFAAIDINDWMNNYYSNILNINIDISCSIRLVTFGQPRIGDLIFSTYLKNKIPIIYRIINRYDIVPHLPLRISNSGFTHTPHEIWIDGDNQINICSLVNENSILNHYEDPFCSSRISPTIYSFDDHFDYFHLKSDLQLNNNQTFIEWFNYNHNNPCEDHPCIFPLKCYPYYGLQRGGPQCHCDQPLAQQSSLPKQLQHYYVEKYSFTTCTIIQCVLTLTIRPSLTSILHINNDAAANLSSKLSLSFKNSLKTRYYPIIQSNDNIYINSIQSGIGMITINFTLISNYTKDNSTILSFHNNNTDNGSPLVNNTSINGLISIIHDLAYNIQSGNFYIVDSNLPISSMIMYDTVNNNDPVNIVYILNSIQTNYSFNFSDAGIKISNYLSVCLKSQNCNSTYQSYFIVDHNNYTQYNINNANNNSSFGITSNDLNSSSSSVDSWSSIVSKFVFDNLIIIVIGLSLLIVCLVVMCCICCKKRQQHISTNQVTHIN